MLTPMSTPMPTPFPSNSPPSTTPETHQPLRLQKRPLAAVLFDLDGTLLDSAADLAAAANALRQQRQLPPLPASGYRPFVGTGARGMLRIALGVQESDSDFAQLREAFFQAYEACMGQHGALFEGVATVLERLHAHHIPWGIVTNKIARFAQPIVAKEPWLARQQALVCGDSTPHIKPHPAPLLAAAQQLGIAPELCLYVGDDERDIQAARAAQMAAVGADYGYLGEAHSAAQWQPDAVIAQPLGLLELLGL